MYFINELAKLAGISTRTLRYYDAIGLLKPTDIDASGYRRYHQKQVDRLQHILMYKKLGFPLKQIKQLMDDKQYNPQEALTRHLKTLYKQMNQLKTLIKTVKQTIKYQNGEITMNNNEKFEGLKDKAIAENEAEYGKEARAIYGDQAVDKANERYKNQSASDYDKAEKLSQEILVLLKEALIENDPHSEVSQRLCEKHATWIKHYWTTYDKQAHLSLVNMYLTDERFKAYYERVGEGATQLLVDAMTIYLK